MFRSFGIIFFALILMSTAPARAAGVVTITDARVVPTAVTIYVGDKVTWTNNGIHTHTVAAAQKAFVGFTLAPSGSHGVRFPKAGRFPYLVDGKITAIVIVRVGAGGASSTTKSSSGYARYDVDISVSVHEHRTGPKEDWDATIEWTGTWKDVSYATAPDAMGVRPRPMGVFMGTISASEKASLFNAMDPNKSPIQCKGDIPSYPEPARLVFSGRYLGANGGMNFSAGPVDGAQSFQSKLDSVKASCSFPPIFIPYPIGFEFTTPDGIDFSVVPATALTLEFTVTSKTKIPFPLDHLIAGQSFGIETGKQTRTNGSGPETVTQDEAVSVHFKAR
ncbi:MAG TPA: hypothetical protein VN934_12600 [Candidatus Tumulicola sp.]|nr:hypothetical protein [Candidatus Tumulicola sp.]